MKHKIYAEALLPFWNMFETLERKLKAIGEEIVRARFRLDYPLSGGGKFRATVWTKRKGGVK